MRHDGALHSFRWSSSRLLLAAALIVGASGCASGCASDTSAASPSNSAASPSNSEVSAPAKSETTTAPAAAMPAVADTVQTIAADFSAEYKRLAIPEFQRGYAENFSTIPMSPVLDERARVLDAYQIRLANIDAKAGSIDEQCLWAQLDFELGTLQMRTNLEKAFREASFDVPPTGLASISGGDAWYALYLRVSASISMSPAEVDALGRSEVDRIKGEIAAIQKKLGFEKKDKAFYRHLNDKAGFASSAAEVQAGYEALYQTALVGLKKQFDDNPVAELKILPVAEPDKNTPPGYYGDNVFHFNFFGGHYNRRLMDWLLIHEGVPGHHFQRTYKTRPPLVPAFTDLFVYPGFDEGWGAYAETLGGDIGLYAQPLAALGKWEWDLVRSTRLVLDVAIHKRGMTRAEAIAYWNQNVPNQSDIAEREVDRITRWPGQVVSYKAGEAKIREWKAKRVAQEGAAFDPKRFHNAILERGSVPLAALTVALDAP